MTLFFLYIFSLLTSIAGMEMMSGLLILLSVIFWYRGKLKFHAIGYDKILFILAAAIIVSGLLSVGTLRDRIDAAGQVRWIPLIYGLVACLIYAEKKWEQLFKFFVIVAAFVGAYSALQAFMGYDVFRNGIYRASNFSGIYLWRAKGFFANTMSYVYGAGIFFCVMTGALMSGYAKKMGGRAFYLFFIATYVILGLSVFFSFTRGAWLALFLAMSIMMIVRYRIQAIKPIAITIVLIIGVTVFVKPVRDRLASIVRTSDRSTAQRFDLWRANWEMFKDNPLLGVGYNENSQHTQQYNIELNGKPGFVANAHNNFLQMLAGCGLLGFLPWLLFSLYVGLLPFLNYGFFRGRGDFSESVILGAIGLHVYFHFGGLTQATFFDKEVAHMYFFWTAMMLAILILNKKIGEPGRASEPTTP